MFAILSLIFNIEGILKDFYPTVSIDLLNVEGVFKNIYPSTLAFVF